MFTLAQDACVPERSRELDRKLTDLTQQRKTDRYRFYSCVGLFLQPKLSKMNVAGSIEEKTEKP